MVVNSHIVVVDDNQTSLRFLTQLLASNGFKNVVGVLTGEEAVVFCRNHVCSVVILDYHLPFMNGVDVIKMVTAETQYTPLPIMIGASADTNPHIREAFKAAGVDLFVTKPINSAKLFDMIKAIHRDYDLPL
jgi:CheY-like chemotaxis protein